MADDQVGVQASVATVADATWVHAKALQTVPLTKEDALDLLDGIEISIDKLETARSWIMDYYYGLGGINVSD